LHLNHFGKFYRAFAALRCDGADDCAGGSGSTAIRRIEFVLFRVIAGKALIATTGSRHAA